MINQVYRLVTPKQFEAIPVDENIENKVVVRPTYLSICNADQRYYTGSREPAVLKKKLPMALIHEGIGKVVYDATNTFKKGQRVVMIPNTPSYHNNGIEENYQLDSKFRSSGFDGFTQELVVLDKDRVVPIFDELDDEVAAFTEMISVAFHAIRHNSALSNNTNDISVGIWGDGNLSYIISNLIKTMIPNVTLYIFGKHADKLAYFTFADDTYGIDEIPNELSIDVALECTGGTGSELAIDQIIDHIKPQGTVNLLGVSENSPRINTRMVLQKGLTLVGTSRSGRYDFEQSLNLLNKNAELRGRFKPLVGIVETVNNISGLNQFFEKDFGSSWGKSIMKWEI